MDLFQREKYSQRYLRSSGTHVAVAASISCLLALVQMVIAKAKNSVKIIIRNIFNGFCPGTKNRIADGPTNSPTMIRTKISRTK